MYMYNKFCAMAIYDKPINAVHIVMITLYIMVMLYIGLCFKNKTYKKISDYKILTPPPPPSHKSATEFSINSP